MPLAEIEEKKQNPHLEERAIVGAKKYRVMSEKFAEDHPVLNTLGYAAGLAPFTTNPSPLQNIKPYSCKKNPIADKNLPKM